MVASTRSATALRRKLEQDKIESNSKKKIKLNGKLDIVSELVNRDLDFIVEKILWHLSPTDISNVSSACPQWMTALRKNWVESFLVVNDEKNPAMLLLKMLFIRNKMLAAKSPFDEKEDLTCFRKACESFFILKGSSPDKLFRKSGEIHFCLPGVFKLWSVRGILFSDEFIAVILGDLREVVVVYSRWTSNLVNAMTARGSIEHCLLPDEGSNYIILNLEAVRRCPVTLQQVRIYTQLAWNLKTGQVQILNKCVKKKAKTSLKKNEVVRIANVAFIIKERRSQHQQCSSAIVFYETAMGYQTLKDISLEIKNVQFVRSGKCLDCFALLGETIHAASTQGASTICQLRSKHDFSLLQAIPLREFIFDYFSVFDISRNQKFLFSDRFLFLLNINEKCVDVRSIWDNMALVHQFGFTASKGIPYWKFYAAGITVCLGKFLLVEFPYDFVAFWEIPPNFSDLCDLQLKGGPNGVSSECTLVKRQGKKSGSIAIVDYGLVHYDYQKDSRKIILQAISCFS